MAMNFIGFTIIRTKKLEEMRARSFDYMDALKKTIEEKQKQIDALFEKLGKDLLETQQKQKDIELRKWCVDRILMDGRHWICGDIEFLYRYVTTGDTAIFQDLKEYREWKAEKREAEKAKAEEAQKSAKESHQQ